MKKTGIFCLSLSTIFLSGCGESVPTVEELIADEDRLIALVEECNSIPKAEAEESETCHVVIEALSKAMADGFNALLK
ncbi:MULTISPECIES: EexN family lipoprotein [unclassified Oleiphilus]|uniref:EexN family lipoprotein n=1 Tax=unclassified Oleiphilus TaxID=2631174 RepID=UPI0007C2A159|nr:MULTISPECIES: EexN family lipoprotein [unclassified Oleiphilus]KZY34047.1 hypothetical protein A3729_18485 [Oleiphilus sp. HI0043]KZY37128.1 hypothetical protein A3729_28610 [Oleiphilus sp. HI0043]KZZ66992.1 hypothetical protein A3763_16690 [Oleiphilus sp. HI0128]